MRQIFYLCCVATLALHLASCRGCRQSERPKATDQTSELAFQATELIETLPGLHGEIIYSNDLLATTRPFGNNRKRRYGGLEIRSKAVADSRKRLAKQGRELLMVDGGNALFAHSNAASEPEKQAALTFAQAMVTMGYDAVALGENELAAGLPFLQQLIATSKLPLLNSNIVSPNAQKRPLFTDRLLLKKGELTYGITAVISSKFLEPHRPTLANLGFEVEAPGTALERQIHALVDAGAQVLVVLCHMGWEEQMQLADRLKTGAIMVSGHGNHRTVIPIQRQQSLIVQTPPRGKFLGVLKVVADSAPAALYDGTELTLIDLKLKRLMAAPQPNPKKVLLAKEELQRFLDQLEKSRQEKHHRLFNFMIALEQKISD